MSRQDPHAKAVKACKAKGYDPKHPSFWRAVEQERQGLIPHDPCRWCGEVAHERIRGELCECHGCWEVTTRLSDFIRRGGKAAREFVQETLR